MALASCLSFSRHLCHGLSSNVPKIQARNANAASLSVVRAQCLGPTERQCHQMHVECICPINSQAIDSWDSEPCVPKPEGVYRLDRATLRCMTCDNYLDGLTSETGQSFAAGDFGCRIYSMPTDADNDGTADGALDVWEPDCLPGEVGAVSNVACPHDSAPEPEPEVGPSFNDPDREVDCGEHGREEGGTCRCDVEENGLKCWQTNRERSNRYPNGNIIEWCSIGMCNMNEEGQMVEASGAQTATPEDCSTTEAGCDIVTQIAYALGVSKQVIYGTWALLLCTGCYVAYSCLCSHDEFDSDNDESVGYDENKLQAKLIKRQKYLPNAPSETEIRALPEKKARNLLLDAEFYRKQEHQNEKARTIEGLQQTNHLRAVHMRCKLYKEHEHDTIKKIKRAGQSVPEVAPSEQVYANIETVIECDPGWAEHLVAKDDEAAMLASVRKLHLKQLKRFTAAAKGAQSRHGPSGLNRLPSCCCSVSQFSTPALFACGQPL